MTKVQLRYPLERPLDDVLLQRLSDANGIYGIFRLHVEPSNDALLVEYDASRLSVDRLERALHRAGIPVLPPA